MNASWSLISKAVKGAPSFAFKGDEFWSVTVDYSECKNKSGFSDCRQSEGSSRVETRDKKNWSMYEGSEVWIHYAIQPKINILFQNDKRRFTVGQCHPSDAGGHKGLTWMLRFRDSGLHIVQYFKHYDVNFKDDDGEWKIKRAILDPESTSWKQTHTLLKKFEANEFKGSNEWTSVMIHHVQSNKKDKGLLEVYIDGDWTNPVYSYKGEMSIPDKNKCYFKNDNITKLYGEHATRKNIEEELISMVEFAHWNKGAELWFSYSGHGSKYFSRTEKDFQNAKYRELKTKDIKPPIIIKKFGRGK